MRTVVRRMTVEFITKEDEGVDQQQIIDDLQATFSTELGGYENFEVTDVTILDCEVIDSK